MTDTRNVCRLYSAPKVVRYGDLAKLTMSSTKGSPEGGSPAASKKT